MKTPLAAKDTDNVLRFLRMLPPRERLRVVAAVLPELEDDLLDTHLHPPNFGEAPIFRT